MTPATIISLAGLAIVLAGILVAVGRVLQRQDASDAANVERDKTIASLREAKHAHAQVLTVTTARVEALAASDARAESSIADLRREHGAVSREILDRLARIESHVEHHSAPPAPPFAPSAPRRHTDPGR